MTRVIGLLSTYAVPILGAALVAAVVAWGIQTWRIGSLQSENGRLAAQINSVVRANRTNMQTIEELERANEQAARRYAEMSELNDHPDPATRWKNRRRMAWLALTGLIAYAPLVGFTDSEQLASVAWPCMSTLGAVVGAYVGFSTWESVNINAKG